jgi:hypothetical protein
MFSARSILFSTATRRPMRANHGEPDRPVSRSASRRRVVALATGLVIVTIVDTGRAQGAEDVIAWNERVLNVIATGGQNNVVQTRSLAMAHAAMHDALNVIERRYEQYAVSRCSRCGVPWASPEAAIAAAAHGVLRGVIPHFGTPAQQAAAAAAADGAYTASMATIPDGAGKTVGISIGHTAASAILAIRSTDGALLAGDPYVPLTGPGFWQPTPNPNPPDPAAGGAGLDPALISGWGNVSPFTLQSSEQFRPDGPPSRSSRKYVRDYDEVKSLGEKLSSARSAEQSETARFWYEGSQSGWNRIARVAAEPRRLDLWDQARLFALLNFAMADGFIAGWSSRYAHHFWRPVTAIREGDTDGNNDTPGDPLWESFLNTPAIPEYPSTHSVLGAAAAEVLARFFRNDAVAFTVTSGAPFAGITRSFSSFSEAAQDNADSRVYAGVHFREATRDGIRLGRRIGAFGDKHYLEPLGRRRF